MLLIKCTHNLLYTTHLYPQNNNLLLYNAIIVLLCFYCRKGNYHRTYTVILSYIQYRVPFTSFELKMNRFLQISYISNFHWSEALFCSFQKNVKWAIREDESTQKKCFYLTYIPRQTAKGCVTSHLTASFILKHVTSHFKTCKVFELFMRVVNGGRVASSPWYPPPVRLWKLKIS